jgi:hypothetical protein
VTMAIVIRQVGGKIFSCVKPRSVGFYFSKKRFIKEPISIQ